LPSATQSDDVSKLPLRCCSPASPKVDARPLREVRADVTSLRRDDGSGDTHKRRVTGDVLVVDNGSGGLLFEMGPA
jgi:hypothetical protein